MAGFEDGAGKTAVAVALWGKSGADMIPLLNDLASGSERQVTLAFLRLARFSAVSPIFSDRL